MKKIFVVLAIAAACAACGSKAVEAEVAAEDTAAVEVVDTVAVDSVVAE